ncbi:MAG: hypothetical protein RL405_792 [Actinomycetota bacterium]|jgi:hypothetical protein
MKNRVFALLATLSMLFMPTPLAANASSTATVVAADSFRTFTGSGAVGISDSATDAAGNVYFMGQTNREITDMAGNVTQVFNFQNSFTDNIFVSKYNASGVLQWTQEIGTTSNESAGALAVSPSGKIAVGGRLCMPLVIAPSISISPLSQFCDPFFAVLDTDGNGLWAKAISEPNVFDPNQWVENLAFDSAENIYAAAYVSSMTDLATYGIDGVNFTRPGSSDYSGTVVVKYSPAGTVSWIKPLPNSANLDGQSLFISNGDVYAGGSFTAPTQFDSLGLFTPSGGDGFALRISGATRNIDQLKVVGGAGAQVVSGFRLDSNGAWLVLSRITGTAVINSVSYASLGSFDSLVTKFSGAGLTTDWVRQIGGTGSEFFTGFALDANNRIYASGSITTSLNLGAAGTFASNNSASGNALLIGLEADGTVAWAKQAISPANGFSLFNALSVFGNSVYAGGQAGGTQTTLDGINMTGNVYSAFNSYASGIWMKVTTSAAGGTVVVNTIVAEPTVIDIVRVSPRLVDPKASKKSITLSGRNLDKVTSVLSGSKNLTHVLLNDATLQVDVSEFSRGSHSLVLTGAGFHFTLQNAFRVQNVIEIDVAKFDNVRQAAKVSKLVRESQYTMSSTKPVTCQLGLPTKAVAKERSKQISLARKFCGALNLRYVLDISYQLQNVNLTIRVTD